MPTLPSIPLLQHAAQIHHPSVLGGLPKETILSSDALKSVGITKSDSGFRENFWAAPEVFEHQSALKGRFTHSYRLTRPATLVAILYCLIGEKELYHGCSQYSDLFELLYGQEHARPAIFNARGGKNLCLLSGMNSPGIFAVGPYKVDDHWTMQQWSVGHLHRFPKGTRIFSPIDLRRRPELAS